MSGARHAPRGAPDRARVELLAAQDATLAEIASAVDRSITTVRYWLAKWDIERPRRRAAADYETAPRKVRRRCRRHGITEFTLERRGYYRCQSCRLERVAAWRRRVKRQLVEEAGGRCCRCGYSRCVAALHFHHLDPGQKAFALSREGVTRSLAEAREEAGKCVLLCANCHAEIEAGEARLDLSRTVSE